MKIINKHNFIPTVCIIYTILSLSKILLEWTVFGNFGDVQLNFLAIFASTIIATFALSQHYRLQKLPFLLMIVVQYAAIIAIVMFGVWLSGFFIELHQNAYRDMFFSVTVPYIIGAISYYLCIFWEVKKANNMIAEIKRKEMNKNEKN